MRAEGSYVDAHGVTIRYYEWKVGAPRGIVQISHGLGEHAGRYEHVAQAFVAAGYTVYADDHRGHGQTGLGQWGGDLERLGRLGPGGLRGTVDAVRQFTRIIRDEHPGTPLAILGHSWGSLLTQIVVNDHPDEYDAVMLSGTAYRTFTHMNGGDLNKRHRHLGTTGNEWLSRDPAVAQAFAEDPLCFRASAITQFGLWDALRLMGRPRRNLTHDVPLLIQIGGDDPFGGERSAELLAEKYISRSGLSDVELIVYTDARHEIFNELNRDEVLADTVAWLEERLPRPAEH
ncbi:alpha/beta hydrolase [Salinibacterium sp. SYSU T00001]|uniref:alpha/beta fold hydrolase n=1 Tax=Homoserinimonas sedimenticola TaxID=2986805 RepID=UPI002235DD2D|nr:alpha/beta hydrolase [Salinibacterium sedimenticola]